MFQKIVERIANTIMECSVELLADQTIDEQTRGIHALHLLQILTTVRSHAPPEAEGFKLKPLPDLMDQPLIPVLQTKSPKKVVIKAAKPAKTKKKWGRERSFPATMIDAALDRSGGAVGPAAAALKCSLHTIYKHCRDTGRKPVDPRDRARPAGIIWNAANRTKLLEIASRVPRPSTAAIGREMGTSAVAIQTALSRSGITRIGKTAAPLTRRPCLNCRTDFMSTHKGNRHCPRCVAENGLAA